MREREGRGSLSVSAAALLPVLVKKLLLTSIAALFLTTGTAHTGDMQQAELDIIAAVRKRYPDASDFNWSDLGKGYYEVDFYAKKGHTACYVSLKPIKLHNCRIVHA
jgi:hypothetical protein